jgi:hypothetical protein
MGAVAQGEDQDLAIGVAWPPSRQGKAYEAQVHGLVVETLVSFGG